jgi:hypothetical protein
MKPSVVLALCLLALSVRAAKESPLPAPAGAGAKPKNRPEVSLRTSGADAEVNVTGGVRLVAVGKSPNFKIYPSSSSSSFIMIKWAVKRRQRACRPNPQPQPLTSACPPHRFGKIYEVTSTGAKVNSHSISSLASETPAFANGARRRG